MSRGPYEALVSRYVFLEAGPQKHRIGVLYGSNYSFFLARRSGHGGTLEVQHLLSMCNDTRHAFTGKEDDTCADI
jgi:hypothetical protein